MKKLAALVACVMFFAVSNAFAFNWWTGGDFKLTSLGGDAEGTSFVVAPAIAHIFSDRLDAGLSFVYSSDDDGTTTTTAWQIAPFVRYVLWGSGNFSILGHFQLEFGSIDNGTSQDTFGVAVMPVLNYALGERWSVFTTFGEIAYRTVSNGSDENTFSASLNMNALVLGFAVAF